MGNIEIARLFGENLKEKIDLKDLKERNLSKRKILNYFKNNYNVEPYAMECNVNKNIIITFKTFELVGSNFILIISNNGDISILSSIMINKLEPIYFLISSNKKFEEKSNLLLNLLSEEIEFNNNFIQFAKIYLKGSHKITTHSIQRQLSFIICSAYGESEYQSNLISNEMKNYISSMIRKNNILTTYDKNHFFSEIIEEFFQNKKYTNDFLSLENKMFKEVFSYINYSLKE